MAVFESRTAETEFLNFGVSLVLENWCPTFSLCSVHP